MHVHLAANSRLSYFPWSTGDSQSGDASCVTGAAHLSMPADVRSLSSTFRRAAIWTMT
jgi:hypothetical protein